MSELPTATLHHGEALDVLRTLPDESVHTCVTSPPYWGLRSYLDAVDQVGLEPTPQEFVARLVEIFDEVLRVLRSDGTAWVNLGDSYTRSGTTNVPQSKHPSNSYPVHSKSGSSDGGVGRPSLPGQRSGCGDLRPKNLVGIPWRVAFALRDAGWYLRCDIVWDKPNAMPESVTDRPTRSHEYIFLLSKSERYYYDHEAIKEDAVNYAHDSQFHSEDGPGRLYKNKAAHQVPGGGPHTGLHSYSVGEKRNKRSVWSVCTRPFKDSHFATFNPELIEPCILAGCPPGGTVLDPFSGSGTTGVVALAKGRNYVGIELNGEYVEMSRRRIYDASPLFANVKVA